MENNTELLRRPLRNFSCPYCGSDIDAGTSSTEHVVSRRFVPNGSLHQSLNVILAAHASCNNKKSGLEDDISVISMLRSGAELTPEVVHKSSKSVSRRTGMKVADSTQIVTFTGSFAPNVTVSERWVAPPQLDES